ncbi:Kinase [Hexamita inflata]|uniref:non-specific serine/threonine protein kinase n=1 Tax=Hexamita inflata TaxID=28002 RepID=A0AA86PV18_9EUKA|nr:Kinase [Hexamita inflata]
MTELLNNRYMMGEMLGKGAFGKVYKAIDIQNGCTVAVKQIKVTNNYIPEEDLNEIRLLKKLNHQFIVKYLDDFITENALNIVTEFLESGSLQQTYKNYGVLSEEYYSKVTYQILAGLKALHESGVLHRDLKAANLLSDRNGDVKITDFGVSETLGQQQNLEAIAGSPYWIAREVLLMEQCDEKSDIWSVGATLYELINGSPPYFDLSPMSAMYHIATDPEIENIPTTFPDAYDFIKKCFIFDVKKRPSIDELLQHQFITKFTTVETVIAPIKNVSDDSEFDSFGSFESLTADDQMNLERLQYDIFKNYTKKQVDAFSKGSFEILKEIQIQFETNSAQHASLLLEQLKKSGMQTLTEGFGHFLNEDFNKQTEQIQKYQIQTYIGLLRFTVFLLKNVSHQNQVELLIELLQFNFLVQFKKIGMLFTLFQKGMIFIENEFKLSSLFCAILETITRNQSIFPAFSSRQGFQQLFYSNELFLNYQCVKQITILVKSITTPNFANGAINVFQKEYLQALGSANSTPLILSMLKKLIFYSSATDSFNNEDFRFTTDFGPRKYKPHPDAHSQESVINRHKERTDLINDLLEIVYQISNQNQMDIKVLANVETLNLIFSILRYFATCVSGHNRSQSNVLSDSIQPSISQSSLLYVNDPQNCKICDDHVQQYNYCSKLLKIFQRIHQLCAHNNYKFDFLDFLPRLEEIVTIAPLFKQDVILNLHSLFYNKHELMYRSIFKKNYLQLLLTTKGMNMVVFDTLTILSDIPLRDVQDALIENIRELNVIDLVLSYIDKKPKDVFTVLGKLYQLPTAKRFGTGYSDSLNIQSNNSSKKKKIAQMIQSETIDIKVLNQLTKTIFNPHNFNDESFLRVADEFLQSVPELCNFIENDKSYMNQLIQSVLDTDQQDNLLLHFKLLVQVYNSSKTPRQMVRKYRLFRQVSGLEMRCEFQVVKMEMKAFMASLLEMELI